MHETPGCLSAAHRDRGGSVCRRFRAGGTSAGRCHADAWPRRAAMHADHVVVARADLTDRNGELLARDLPVKDLYARPHVFWDKAQAAHDLARGHRRR